MNEQDKIEIRNLIKKEVEKRGNSLINQNLPDYKMLKTLRNILLITSLLLIISNYLLPAIGLKLFRSEFTSKTPILVFSSLLFAGFLHYQTLKYNKRSNLDIQKWFQRTGFKAIFIFLIGYIGSIIFLASTLPTSPTKHLILIFVLGSCIGYYLLVFLIATFPKYFFNQLITHIATFFRLTIIFSAIELLLLIIFTSQTQHNLVAERDLLHPGIIQYIGWISGIIIAPLLYMDLTYIVSGEKLDLAQIHILSFYLPSRIINSLKNSRSIKQSEIEALQLFIDLEKEGDEDKERALLVYLNNKYGTKGRKIYVLLFSIISFVFLCIAEELVQFWFFDPVKNWIIDFWKLIRGFVK